MASKRPRTGHESYYRQVDGVKCDRALLEAAERAAKHGAISLSEAMDLWEKAKDGNRITAVERQTLGWVLEHLQLTEKAKAFLEQQLSDGSYYTTIGHTKYSRGLLEKAEGFAAEQSISQQQALELWQLALDGERLGDCERRTLRYILQNLNATTGAKKFLLSKLDPAVTPPASAAASSGAAPAVPPRSLSVSRFLRFLMVLKIPEEVQRGFGNTPNPPGWGDW
ncbi:unnamed protein product [Durusdinium trenchii]|uniref:Uncharacterized protein n=1 Tax=Durusdinium trenchii TaxID=1381693 RepID=A0ABP0I825_9DINO